MRPRAELESNVKPRFNRYPATHYTELQRFITGNDYDPKGLFRLTADVWDAWPYATHGRPTEAPKYRIYFRNLLSFIKPYLKLYIYERLIAGEASFTGAAKTLPNSLAAMDRIIYEHGFDSLDDVAPSLVFQPLWEEQLRYGIEENAQPKIWRQKSTHYFWVFLSRRFGSPLTVPPPMPLAKRRPTDYALDESKIIPPHVIRQLGNKLAHHRDGSIQLNPYNHLRLCVLMLAICVGRRIDEVLYAPRCSGPEGPLNRYPSRSGSPEGALWFRFRPNKNGYSEDVYISQEWEDLAIYCVRALIKYGDEVREFADPSEQDMLILISTHNRTSGGLNRNINPADDLLDTLQRNKNRSGKVNHKHHTKGLSYNTLRTWLRGNRARKLLGIMHIWNITADGSANGQIYKIRTNYARHTRQSALSNDPNVPLLARQRDLNQADVDVQFVYQHSLREQNNNILAKCKQGQCIGPGVEWLSGFLQLQTSTFKAQSQFQPGQPTFLSSRWRQLISKSPHLVQFNRVRGGYCALPQGPSACSEYMNCTSAAEGGCQCFLTDPSDEHMVVELSMMAIEHRRQQQESAAAGRIVQAEKREVIARRTEKLRDEALGQASNEVRNRLRALLHDFTSET